MKDILIENKSLSYEKHLYLSTIQVQVVIKVIFRLPTHLKDGAQKKTVLGPEEKKKKNLVRVQMMSLTITCQDLYKKKIGFLCTIIYTEIIFFVYNNEIFWLYINE